MDASGTSRNEAARPSLLTDCLHQQENNSWLTLPLRPNNFQCTTKLLGAQDMLDAVHKGYAAGGYRDLMQAMLLVLQRRMRNGISVSPVIVARLYLRYGGLRPWL